MAADAEAAARLVRRHPRRASSSRRGARGAGSKAAQRDRPAPDARTASGRPSSSSRAGGPRCASRGPSWCWRPEGRTTTAGLTQPRRRRALSWGPPCCPTGSAGRLPRWASIRGRRSARGLLRVRRCGRSSAFREPAPRRLPMPRRSTCGRSTSTSPSRPGRRRRAARANYGASPGDERPSPSPTSTSGPGPPRWRGASWNATGFSRGGAGLRRAARRGTTPTPRRSTCSTRALPTLGPASGLTPGGRAAPVSCGRAHRRAHGRRRLPRPQRGDPGDRAQGHRLLRARDRRLSGRVAGPAREPLRGAHDRVRRAGSCRAAGRSSGTSRTNPLRSATTGPSGSRRRWRRLHLDGLIAIGGEDTLGAAAASTASTAWRCSECRRRSTTTSRPRTSPSASTPPSRWRPRPSIASTRPPSPTTA